MNSLLNSKVSFQRLLDFLRAEEKEEYRELAPESTDSTALALENGSFAWEAGSASGRITLQGLNINVPRGKLVALIGAVGSGKSSVLQAFLGEIPRIDGRVIVNGQLAYVGQTVLILLDLPMRDRIRLGCQTRQYVIISSLGSLSRRENTPRSLKLASLCQI